LLVFSEWFHRVGLFYQNLFGSVGNRTIRTNSLIKTVTTGKLKLAMPLLKER
jgi:hypothetical protein